MSAYCFAHRTLISKGIGTVLVVDDDRDVRAGARLRLRAAGYQTLEAVNGRQGVDMAVQQQPDAILMDVRMPEMDGLTALAALQKNEGTRDIPVIMLSASIVDQTSALDSGARFFLSKPYEGHNLIEAIETALQS